MGTEHYTPSVQRSLRKLGQDIQIARKKRRMTVENFADRLGVTKGTVIRLERGEAGVSIGTLSMALLALGELHRLTEMLDVSKDDAGLLLDQSRLPERVRHPRAVRKDVPPDDEPGSDPGGFAF
jgi:transcriptional regulator with XRE-family HTH domain